MIAQLFFTPHTGQTNCYAERVEKCTGLTINGHLYTIIQLYSRNQVGSWGVTNRIFLCICFVDIS